MTTNTRFVKAGLTKQTDKGSPATDADFAFGVLGGQVLNAELTNDDLDPTADDRILSSRERTLVVPGADFEAVALPASVGLLLLGACGNVDTSGTDPDFTHTFTSGADLPYLTVFSDFDGDKREVHDAKIDTLEISFDGTSRTEVSATFVGCDLTFDSSYTEAGENERPNSSNVFRGVGGTFTFDGSAARVNAGSVTVSNETETIDLADSVLPDDVVPTNQPVEVSLTIVPEDLTDWRKIVAGAVGNDSASDEPLFAEATIELVTGNGEALTFTASNAAWVADHPDADPDGEPAELELEGVVTKPTDGSDAYSFTLENSVDSY